MKHRLAILAICATLPVYADKYEGPEPQFDSPLLTECIGYDFLTGWANHPDLPPELTPDAQACMQAKLPCHVRYDLPLDDNFDLSTLTLTQQHPVSHCLYQHLEEAEWQAFENMRGGLRLSDNGEQRTEVRHWLRYARLRNAKCATKFSERDINRVACQLKAALRHIPKPDDVRAYHARVDEWGKSQ